MVVICGAKERDRSTGQMLTCGHLAGHEGHHVFGGEWRPVGQLPDELRGEQCSRCKTLNNVVWFTDNVLWNEVIRQGDYIEPALCIPCFVLAVAARGLSPTGWRLIPDWHWETTAEYDQRRRPE